MPTYTCVLPFVEYDNATEWHPTTRTGPFSTLVRGNFQTEGEAIAWARKNLKGAPYTVKCVEEVEAPMLNLNGSWVSRRGNTIFIPLPKALRRDCGGCVCDYCKAHPDETPQWDTLAVSETKPAGNERNDTTWTVHAPELAKLANR